MADILILDDSNELLEMVQFILKMNGHHVRIANTKEIFLEEIEKAIPQLIMLDIYVKDTDGRELCRTIKQAEGTKHIPVILISGNPDTLASYQDCYADAILEKPFNLNDLTDKIDSLISAS